MDQGGSSSFLYTLYVIGMLELALGQFTGFIFFSFADRSVANDL